MKTETLVLDFLIPDEAPPESVEYIKKILEEMSSEPTTHRSKFLGEHRIADLYAAIVGGDVTHINNFLVWVITGEEYDR